MKLRTLPEWARRSILGALVVGIIGGCLLIGRMEAQAAYGKRQPLYVTTITGITSAWPGECAAGVLDNRSTASRQLDYIGIFATGSPSWTVALNYSDSSCSGPWTSFGSAASISDASAVPVAYGFGYHPFVQVLITGSATVNLSGTRGFYPPIH